jgi:hypothetical protein
MLVQPPLDSQILSHWSGSEQPTSLLEIEEERVEVRRREVENL